MRFRKPPQRRTIGGSVAEVALRIISAGASALTAALCAIGRGIRRIVAPMPTRLRLSLWFVAAAGLLAAFAIVLLPGIRRALWEDEELLRVLDQSGMSEALRRTRLICFIAAGVSLLAAGLAWVKAALVHRALKIIAAMFAGAWLWGWVLIVAIARTLSSRAGDLYTFHDRNVLLVLGTLAWLPGAVWALIGLIAIARRSTKLIFRPEHAVEPGWADRFAEDFRTHGRDPRFRRSTYWSAFLHATFILGPFVLVAVRGCASLEYRMPGGKGQPEIQQVRVVKVQRKKIERMALNPNSPILHYRPDIEEMRHLEEIVEQTRDQYQADTSHANIGQGGKGKGGWPSGLADAPLRFLRLKYSGGDWDQDMGFGSDYNLLLEYHKLTGMKIADKTEYITISQLRRFKTGAKPPFVYITGMRGMSISSSEAKILRTYAIKEGGMIFADNGGGRFDRSFRSAMRRAFPELRWIDIPNDDPIYRAPYVFPNGAPPLWHHSGYRALGLWHEREGRWIVFYHQGDLGDAWKTGHSGAPRHVAMSAYRMGINVIYYAFSRYDQFIRRQKEQ